MRRTFPILSLLLLFLLIFPNATFSQSALCFSFENKIDCETPNGVTNCSWCSSVKKCLHSSWDCIACEDVSYVHCGTDQYPGCKGCALNLTCVDVDKPCYCGNGDLNVGEECDSTPHCDSTMCTCNEGYIKDPNNSPYCCCDGCTCSGIASTDSSVCSGNGVCIGSDDCICFEGWSGSECSNVADTDGDGIPDRFDNCPNTANPDQADADGDGSGDVCDACIYDANNDADGDGVCGDVDNCPMHSNPDQFDTEKDGYGDACDPDDDNDGVLDYIDNCPLDFNADQEDFDGDGAGDACDFDDDGDGVLDAVDACVGTMDGEIVNHTGCSISDLCPCGNDWKNHGAYVRCVAHTSQSFAADGLISEADQGAVVSEAGQSDCGFKK